MMKEMESTLFEEIEAYLKNTMEIGARESFSQRIAMDPDLSHEVEFMRDNMLAIEMNGFQRSMREAADGYRKENPSIDPKPVEGTDGVKWVLRIAALVAVAVGVGWWSLRPNLNKKLYAEYHVIDPGLPVPMSATDEFAFHDAMVDFKMGKYQKAIDKWSPLLIAEPTNDTLRFYIASAKLEIGDHTEAAALFNNVTQGGSGFKQKAEWYLMLTYLKAGEWDKVQQINPNESSPYATRIKELKQRIRE